MEQEVPGICTLLIARRRSGDFRTVMADRSALLQSALDSMPDGLAVFDNEGSVVFWNAAAQAVTGYSLTELEGNGLPRPLYQLLHDSDGERGPQLLGGARSHRGTQVRTRHKFGHEVPVITRSLLLQDDAGDAIGTAVLFHPAERLDALPHGEEDDERPAASNQAEFEDRLNAEFEDFVHGGEPLGILWVSVDQGQNLHTTHGAAACRSMIEKVRHALAGGLRPTEEIARWSDDEFLILAHERTPEMLARHAFTLAGLARTADFRWWGDRISLTVSIGVAQASRSESLRHMLESARKAMELSMRTGGNRVTCAPREKTEQHAAGDEHICTPS